MRVEHTWASRAAVPTALALGLLQPAWITRDLARPLVAAALVLAAATLMAAAKMAHDNCFDSRLALVILATVQLGEAGLTVTVGLPGQAARHADPLALWTLAIAAAVSALVGADHRRRHLQAAQPA